MIRMSETTRTHTTGKQLDCDILISPLMKHLLTNRPTFHSDSEKLCSKIWATKSSSSDQTWHMEKQKEVWYGLWYDIHLSLALFRYPCYWIHSIIITPLFNWKKKGVSTHRGTYHWSLGATTPPSLPPPFQILGNSDFWGSKRNLGKPNFYKSFHVSFR